MTEVPDRSRWTDDRLDRMSDTVERLGERVDSFVFESQRLFNSLGERQARSEERLDSFVFESQRLFNSLGEGQARVDAAVESMVDAVTRLTRNSAQQWQAIQQMQTEVREMQAEVRGLQVENRRILQRVFGDE
jgi:ABC-type transporter Mla subunit MlaD